MLQLGPLYVGHTRRWAEHAAALGATVFVAGHHNPGRRVVRFEDVAQDVAIYDGTDAATWLRGVLDRFAPDIVHAHWLPRWCRIAAQVACCPVVATAWGSDVYLAAGEQRAQADEAVANADAVLVRSDHMARELVARGAPRERLHAVDLGVNLHRFSPPTPAERAAARAELGLPDGPLILSPRAATPLYNLDVVVAGFELLRERLPAATLVLAHGDLPLNVALPAGARSVGDVPHDEIHRYLRAATAVVSIPISDGSPSSVWEALASGVPVVASDLPQLRERLGAGVARLIAPTPETVAQALFELATRPGSHAQAAAAGRAWALANVDERRELRRLAAVYELVRRARTTTAVALPLRPS